MKHEEKDTFRVEEGFVFIWRRTIYETAFCFLIKLISVIFSCPLKIHIQTLGRILHSNVLSGKLNSNVLD